MAKHSPPALSRPALFAAAFLIAVGGLIYELILGTAASYLFGDSIVSFSLATGITLFGMGIGSLLASKVAKRSAEAFAWNEILLGFVGGTSVLVLFTAFNFTKLYWLVFILLSLIIGILIGLEIPLMMRLFKSRGKRSVMQLLGRVLALDYFGALAASLLFPFVLLPYLGLMRTAFLVAVLNVAVAFYLLRKIGASVRASGGALLLVGLLLMGFIFSTKLENAIDAAAYRDPIVYTKISPYQKIVLTQYKNDTRLYLNNQLQFSSLDEARYHETLAHAAMTSARIPKHVVILGGGDGLLAREILKYPSVQNITIIDIDPAITTLGKEHRLLRELNGNALNDRRVSIISADAFTTLKETDALYDVILADLVDPSNERIAKLYSKEFYRTALQHLTPSGIFITQATSSYFTPRAFGCVADTLHSVDTDRQLTSLSVNVPSFGEWGFVLSAPHTAALFQETKLPDSLSYTSLDRLRIAQRVVTDQQRTSCVSTLIHPKIYTIYSADMQQWRY